MIYHWIELKTVLAIHDMQIQDHGGVPGIRDLGLIESVLARPQNLSLHADPTVTDLAAEYAFGIAKNHGFVDGNKRTAYVVTRLFLKLHSWDFFAPPEERVLVFEALGKGKYTVEQFAEWMRHNSGRIMTGVSKK